MRSTYIYSFFIIGLIISVANSQLFSQSTGLRFFGHEHVTSDRTSLALFSQKPCKTSNHFNLEFDFAIEKNYQSYFGYILRILNDEGDNIDFIIEYNREIPNHFTLLLIIGENEPLLSLPVSMDYLYQWKKIKIDFDIVNKSYSLNVGNYHTEEKGDFLPLNNSLQVFFGANHEDDIETTDLPNMKIRDIVFSKNHKITHNWPLNNHEGTESYDIINNKKALIENPYWLHQDHVEWETANSYLIDDIALITYNQKENLFYIVSSDSLFTIKGGTQTKASKVKFSEKLNISKGQGLIFDTIHNELVWYSIDLKLISKYNKETNSWSQPIPKMNVLTEYWQHNSFISPQDSSLKIIGGYGQHQYKNIIHTVNLKTGEWDVYEPDHLDFAPRYLSGFGVNNSADTSYIIGGYGSVHGDQKLRPKYWYELSQFIPASNKVEKIISYDNLDIEGFCFANSMIIQDENFYVLVFSKFEYNNYLQLFKGSLYSDSFEAFSEKIPFNFHDVMTFVDLYFSPKDEKLYTSISFINDINETDINIYEINFPPEQKLIVQKKESNINVYLILLGTIILFGFILFYLLRKSKNVRIPAMEKSDENKSSVLVEKQETSVPSVPSEEITGVSPVITKDKKAKKNQVLLFGGFQIINREGADITAKFTPLLKEMFLLLFLNSFGDRKGVSSEYLKEILWSDKSSKDARNNRAVNMSKLKSILAEVGNSTISKDTGYWKVNIDYSQVYVDYAYLYNIVHSSVLDQKQMSILIDISKNKPFLKNISNDWLDSFKAEVSNDTVDTLVKWAMDNVEKSDPSFIIPITDAVFEFDSINEEAVELKCRSLVKLGKHSLAKTTYDNFVKDYKILYEEDYHTSFNALIS